jgi:EAL and modified HD-GYP domain-containing signal transduction protein
VAADAVMAAPADLARGHKISVNFSARTIEEDVPRALPPEACVVQYSEKLEPEPRLLDALADLRGQGYTLALDDFEARPRAAELLKLAHVVVVDVEDMDAQRLADLARAALSEERRLQAKKVETQEKRQMAADAGCTLFQGNFFKRPEMVPGRRLDSSEITRLELLKLTRRDDPDMEKLVATLKSDVSLSYRLLTYLNCPLFTFPRRIESIEQAVLLLGWLQLRHWLRVVVLADMAPGGPAGELPHFCIQRARFLELAARELDTEDLEPETMFLLGLFSLLDAMLRLPMDEILSRLPLDPEVAEALAGENRNRYSDWLDLVRSFEVGDWTRLDTLMSRLSLEPSMVAKCYFDSQAWADFFREQTAHTP